MRTIHLIASLLIFSAGAQAQNQPEAGKFTAEPVKSYLSEKAPTNQTILNESVRFTSLLQQNIVLDVQIDHNRKEVQKLYERTQIEITTLQKEHPRAGALAKNTFDECLNQTGYGVKRSQVVYSSDDKTKQVITELNDVYGSIRQLRSYPEYSSAN